MVCLAIGGRNVAQHFGEVEVRMVGWSPDASHVVVTKHHGLSSSAISTVRRRDNQQADEADNFTILTFTISCLVSCRVSDDPCLNQQIAYTNHLSSSSIPSF